MNRLVLLATLALALATACSVTTEDVCQHAVECGVENHSVEDCVNDLEQARARLSPCPGAQAAFDDYIFCSGELSCEALQNDETDTACNFAAFAAALDACSAP